MFNAYDLHKVRNLDKNLDKYTYLGEGRNGVVYLMPDGKVIKVFKKLANCLDEYQILKSVRGNKHFPKVYECTQTYMVRDYVGGTVLPKYIKKNGLSQKLALNLIELIEDFKRLGFARLDVRCPHIYVQEDESVIVIDPRQHYTKTVKYPYHLTGGLREAGVLDKFMQVLKKKKPSLYEEWKDYIRH